MIAPTKIRNNYDAIQSFIFQYCDSNIGLFFIAPWKVITINPLCILFGISSLLLFFMALSLKLLLYQLSLILALKSNSKKIFNNFR